MLCKTPRSHNDSRTKIINIIGNELEWIGEFVPFGDYIEKTRMKENGNCFMRFYHISFRNPMGGNEIKI